MQLILLLTSSDLTVKAQAKEPKDLKPDDFRVPFDTMNMCHIIKYATDDGRTFVVKDRDTGKTGEQNGN